MRKHSLFAYRINIKIIELYKMHKKYKMNKKKY